MKILILDETGSINKSEEKERYFILGGLLYDLADFESIKDYLVPKMEKYRKIKNKKELKSNYLSGNKNLNNLIYGSLISDINSCKELTPIIYILDKKFGYRIKDLDKVSFKYNKFIEFLIKDLLEHGYIAEQDKIKILIDEYTFDEYNQHNFENWLPQNVKQVDSIEMGKSDQYKFIQIADLLAGIPKLKGVTPKSVVKDHKLQLLDRPFVNVFPKSKRRGLLD